MEDLENKQTDEHINDEQDPFLDKFIIIFLVILLLAIIFIPSEWFLKLSMWINGINP